MTLSAYCLTCWDASSSLLMCNSSVWVKDCKIGPSRCSCAGKPEHAGGRGAAGGVWLRWAHTCLHSKGETASQGWVGFCCCSQPHSLHLNTAGKFAQPAYSHWKWEIDLLGLGSFPALLWQTGALPPSSGIPVNLSKMRKHLLTNPLCSKRCHVKSWCFSHLTWLLSTLQNLRAGFRALTQFPFDSSSQCEWMFRGQSCHPAACPYGTTGNTTAAFYQWFKLIYLFVKLKCWEHPLPPHTTECNCCWESAAGTWWWQQLLWDCLQPCGCCLPYPGQWALRTKLKEH